MGAAQDVALHQMAGACSYQARVWECLARVARRARGQGVCSRWNLRRLL